MPEGRHAILGGFAIPEGTIATVSLELERIAASFDAARSDFLSRYDDAIQDWITRHPAFAEVISRAVDPVEVVAANLKFDYVVFRVSHPESSDAENPQAISATLNRKVECLSDSLFREVAQEASELVEQSLLGRQSVTRKALSPFRRIRDKLDGLAFLDHRVSPVVHTIDDLLSRVPKTGALDGAYLQEVFAFALLLSDPDKIRRHGEGLAQTVALSSGIDPGNLPPSVQDEENQAEVDSQSVVDSRLEPSLTESSPIDRFHLFDGIEEELDEKEAPAESTVEAQAVFVPMRKPELAPALPADFWF